jgi:hemerythrin-like domain-containing protein
MHMTSPLDDHIAVVETRVVHDAHRRATTLLADAAATGRGSSEAFTTLRDFVVAMLRHHHESEDRDLWVLLAAAAPALHHDLDALSAEHDRLDDALDRMLDDPSAEAAADLRELVHSHLAHEEPVLFPALRAHLTDGDWDGFSRRAVESAPAEDSYLFVGLFHQVATEDEVAVVLRNLPPEAQAAAPAMRIEAERVLGALDVARR